MTPAVPQTILPAFIAERLSTPRPIALAERRGQTTRILTSDEVHQRAAAVASAIRAAGLQRGDRVAIVAENSVDWLIADFGILYAGCVVVPVFASVAADQLSYILTDSEAKTPSSSAAPRRPTSTPADSKASSGASLPTIWRSSSIRPARPEPPKA